MAASLTLTFDLWYAFHGYNNGDAINATAVDAINLDGAGMHGYKTKAEAEAKPNSVNILQAPFVNAAIDDYNNARDISPTQANKTGPGSSAAIDAATHTASGAAAAAAKPALSGIDAVGAFANSLGQASTWIRVLKVAVGGMLLVIGIVHMTGASGAIAETARKVPVPI